MISKIAIDWNEKWKNDGMLYFFQRITEMLDYRTIDIFRTPLLNTSRLIDEYLSICNGGAKAYHLEEVYHEFLQSFDSDIILNYRIGEERIHQMIDRLNRFPDKRKESMDYIRHSLAVHYLDWTKEYIMIVTAQTKEKKKIERAVRCLIPELLRRGYNRDEIYHTAKKFLENDIDPQSAISSFLSYYDCKRRHYTVYLCVSNKLLAFKEILSGRISACFEDDGNFVKLGSKNNYSVVKFANLEALDASNAADYAYQKIEFFTTFYQFFGNYSGYLVQNRAMVISEEGEEMQVAVNRGKYKSIEENDPPKIGEVSEQIITALVYTAKCSIPMLEKITRLHNRAISNNGLENGFLNLWSILEIICVSDYEGSKIKQVEEVAVPILKHNYLYAFFKDIMENLKVTLSEEEYSSLINTIDDGEEEVEKIASFVLLDKYTGKLDEFVDCLVNYPVLRSRILNMHEDCKNNKDLNAIINRYEQRIRWHIYRMYRARNAISHSGKHPKDLKDLGEHLHSYVDSIVNEIIIKLGTGDLCHVSNALVELELKNEIQDKFFNTKNTIDTKTIQMMFSYSNQWSEIIDAPQQGI